VGRKTKQVRHGEGKHRLVGKNEEETWFKKQRVKNRVKNKLARKARRKQR
jgi:hypothetical protein